MHSSCSWATSSFIYGICFSCYAMRPSWCAAIWFKISLSCIVYSLMRVIHSMMYIFKMFFLSFFLMHDIIQDNQFNPFYQTMIMDRPIQERECRLYVSLLGFV